MGEFQSYGEGFPFFNSSFKFTQNILHSLFNVRSPIFMKRKDFISISLIGFL